MFTLWKVTRAAFDATSKLLQAQLRGAGDEGDDEGAEPVDDAVVLSQMGVAIRPLIARTLRALGYQDGNDVWVLKLWDKAGTPTDLAAGETRLYAVGAITNVVQLLTGGVVVEAPSIKLGSSATKKVNREGDALRPGSLTVGATATVLTITYAPPDGGATQSAAITLTGGGGVPAAFTPATTTITLAGKTGPGSNKVRAED